MARWTLYLKERFPIGTYLFLSLGLALSGLLLSLDLNLNREDRYWQGLVVSTLGLMVFFGELRLMDELKDYSKDLVAHPSRPLPRGILKITEVRRTILIVFFFMIVFAIFVSLFQSLLAGLFYLVVTLYLWLMYKEFYSGKWLSDFPLFYAFTHQIILIPICLFVVAVQTSSFFLEGKSIGYSMTVLGAFFGYEVCRKLDPQANPILKTYLSIYGPSNTGSLVFALLTFAAWGAYRFQAHLFLWPVELLTWISMMTILKWPNRFKVVEFSATLCLAFHIWSVPLKHLVRKFI